MQFTYKASVVNINIVVLRPFSNSNQPIFLLHSFIDFTLKLSRNHPFTPLVQRKHTTIASHHLAISFVYLYTSTQHLYLPFRSVNLFTCVYKYVIYVVSSVQSEANTHIVSSLAPCPLHVK